MDPPFFKRKTGESMLFVDICNILYIKFSLIIKTKSENSTQMCLWQHPSVYQGKLKSTSTLYMKPNYKIQCTTVYLQSHFKNLLLNSNCQFPYKKKTINELAKFFYIFYK